MQCGLAYHNSNTPLCLDVNLSCCLHLESSFWGLFSFLIDISCISHAITYSNVNSFMGLFFNVVIKYSYEWGKLSNNVITTFLSLTPTSK
jgi:hypothetical protein